jgi:tRNA threonylcarbamoyl adenosine modification protein (Sua5/YciO/YrdC/YwlC family)
MKQLPKILVSKRKTVGVRVPDSKATLAIVKALGHPILSTSVTDEAGAVLHDPEDIKALYKNVVDLILDGGTLPSEQSTVLDLTGDEPVVVRKGAGDISVLG